MANNCPVCMANMDIVGRVHRCRDAMPTVNPVPSVAASASADGDGTYKYRDADKRRSYMRDYMKRKRNA